MPQSRIAIIGGGPAGLSLARMLMDDFDIKATVFEAEDRVGGKSLTFSRGDFLCEMGTCYATRADRIARRWMKAAGLKTIPLGDSTFGGQKFMDYVRSAPGGPLPVQLLRYTMARRGLLKRVAANLEDRDALAEAAQPIAEWLADRKLDKIARIHQRGMTVMGYGFLEETSTLQALRWVDLDLIISGATRDIVTPVDGWSSFWDKIAEGLDIKRSNPVVSIERNSNGSMLTSAEGQSCYDLVVCAMPLDEFTKLTDPTCNERIVNNGVQWRDYCTTLVAADWFREEQTRGYISAMTSPSQTGRLLAARHEGRSDALGGDLYVCGQLIGTYSLSELREILVSDIAADGGHVANTVMQKPWKYFAQYEPDAIRNGLLGVMAKMQGERSTWYTGATFSHEAVSKITNFNKQLAARIANSVAEH